MEYYMDEASKVNRADKKNNNLHSYGRSSLSRSVSQRSFSQKNSSGLSRSTSHKIPSTKSTHSTNSSQRYSEFTRMAKEQKSKFYIVKRCISMLVSWKKHEDS